ncbi:type IV secretion protein Rhs [Xenorhabdus sp. Flor]|nr:type IV secretion protein Rhs [Xenorhabdus sp. Flor]
MLNENGTLVWAQRLSTWGKAEKSQVIASNDPDYHVGCNFRFCGQYEDQESGLYYNRFRYYNPETAQYISADPIGLLGGVNPYGYVHNPTNRIDPFGLTPCPTKFGSRNEALRGAKRDAGIPMNQHPNKVDKIPLTDMNGKKILDANHKPIETREYHFIRPDGSKIVIQEHSAGHIYGPPGTPGNQGPHFNIRPFDPKTGAGSRNGKIPGTSEHYEY